MENQKNHYSFEKSRSIINAAITLNFFLLPIYALFATYMLLIAFDFLYDIYYIYTISYEIISCIFFLDMVLSLISFIISCVSLSKYKKDLVRISMILQIIVLLTSFIGSAFALHLAYFPIGGVIFALVSLIMNFTCFSLYRSYWIKGYLFSDDIINVVLRKNKDRFYDIQELYHDGKISKIRYIAEKERVYEDKERIKSIIAFKNIPRLSRFLSLFVPIIVLVVLIGSNYIVDYDSIYNEYYSNWDVAENLMNEEIPSLNDDEYDAIRKEYVQTNHLANRYSKFFLWNYPPNEETIVLLFNHRFSLTEWYSYIGNKEIYYFEMLEVNGDIWLSTNLPSNVDVTSDEYDSWWFEYGENNEIIIYSIFTDGSTADTYRVSINPYSSIGISVYCFEVDKTYHLV